MNRLWKPIIRVQSGFWILFIICQLVFAITSSATAPDLLLVAPQAGGSVEE